MAMRTKCPHCGKTQRLDANFGDRVECGDCSKGFRLKAPKKPEDDLVEVEEVDPDKEGYSVGGVSGSNAAREVTRAETKKLKQKMEKDRRIRRPTRTSSDLNLGYWIWIAFCVLALISGLSIFAGSDDPMKRGFAAFKASVAALVLISLIGKKVFDSLE